MATEKRALRFAFAQNLESDSGRAMDDRNVVFSGVNSGADDCGAFVSGTTWGCWKDGVRVGVSDGVWGLGGICNRRRFAVAGPAVVVTCTWKGAVALAARVIGVGITVHVAPAGAPEQVRVTGPAKPSMDWRLS